MTTNTAFFCYKDPDIRFTYFCLIDVREYSLKTLPQLENTASAFLTLRVEIHVNIWFQLFLLNITQYYSINLLNIKRKFLLWLFARRPSTNFDRSIQLNMESVITNTTYANNQTAYVKTLFMEGSLQLRYTCANIITINLAQPKVSMALISTKQRLSRRHSVWWLLTRTTQVKF